MTPRGLDAIGAQLDLAVGAAAVEMLGISHALAERPELAYEEVFASGLLADALAAAGFDVERGLGGIDTAFSATFGSGSLVIGLCAEYDALPGIGHACGHNTIAASAFGAALALRDVADELDLTVRLIGTPAEESGGGKVLLLERGAFDGLHAALMTHPGGDDICAPGTTAISVFDLEFRGRSAHAAQAPHEGVNAADAAVLAQVGAGMIRAQMLPGERLSVMIAEAGTAPNVIPDRAVLVVTIRAENLAAVLTLRERVQRLADGAAYAIGATAVMEEQFPPYAEVTTDEVLARHLGPAFEAVGRPATAAAPIGASTDMGNVSHRFPSAHPIIRVGDGTHTPHMPEFAVLCAGEAGDAAVIDGARILARTVAGAALDPESRERLLLGGAVPAAR